jgi:formylglycine-generating enzyme required for sulfatase activity
MFRAENDTATPLTFFCMIMLFSSLSCVLDLDAVPPPKAMCGNGVIEPGEQCEGEELQGMKCENLNFEGGTLRCSNCLFDTSLCIRCGDGIMNGNEQCDGDDLGDGTCIDQGFSGGLILGCKSDCTFDYSGCTTKGFVTFKAGTFLMGSPESENCRKTLEEQHQVTLTHDFEIQQFEVTQGLFKSVMGYNPASFAVCGDDCPVETVSWHEAAAFCNKLSDQHELEECYECSGDNASATCQLTPTYAGKKIYACAGYRLPTEAEWEYAYRAGTQTAFYNGDITSCIEVDDNADKIAWYDQNSDGTTHPIGQKDPNDAQLHDMGGNVWEWCQDWYAAYGSSSVTDPFGAEDGSNRIMRGGSFLGYAKGVRAANRLYIIPTSAANYLGFRCARGVRDGD